jgi:hypothetical protein
VRKNGQTFRFSFSLRSRRRLCVLCGQKLFFFWEKTAVVNLQTEKPLTAEIVETTAEIAEKPEHILRETRHHHD